MSQVFICSKFCNSEGDEKELKFDKEPKRSTKLEPKMSKSNDGTAFINISPMKFVTTEKKYDYEDEVLNDSTISSKLGIKKHITLNCENENRVNQMDKLVTESYIETDNYSINVKKSKTGTFVQNTADNKSTENSKLVKYGDIFSEDYESHQFKGIKAIKISQPYEDNSSESKKKLSKSNNKLTHIIDGTNPNHNIRKINSVKQQTKIEDYSVSNTSRKSKDAKKENIYKNKSTNVSKTKVSKNPIVSNDIFSMNNVYNKISKSK